MGLKPFVLQLFSSISTAPKAAKPPDIPSVSAAHVGMFSFASRAAMRKAPNVAALSAGAMVTLPRIKQNSQCKETNQVSALRTRSRVGTEKAYSVEMGKTLMKIFHA